MTARIHKDRPLTGAEIAARWRKKHPEKYLAAARKYAKKHRKQILTYQRGRYATVYARGRAMVDRHKDKPCMDCGGSFLPCVMEFDHVRGEKYKEVGVMWGYCEERLLAEIAKCDLVCANCHRVRTFNRGQFTNHKVTFAKEEK